MRRLAAAADETAAALDTALAERRAYVEQLAAEQELARTQIGSLEAEAAAAAARSAQVSSSPAPTPVSAPAPEAASPPPAPVLQPDVVTSGTRTLTVEATGYALTGRTASGLRTGWGIVAVDPSVIPLGTRMTVPGYGEAVAADTGSAVNGLEIDLWFPTTADALAWGRRTVTITLN